MHMQAISKKPTLYELQAQMHLQSLLTLIATCVSSQVMQDHTVWDQQAKPGLLYLIHESMISLSRI